MKRRDFVKGLAVAQLAAMTSTLKGASTTRATGSEIGVPAAHPPTSGIKRLNVVVHGMFAIIVDPKGKLDPTNHAPKVYLKAPQVTGAGAHRYRAQTFTVDPSNPNNVLPGWQGGDYEVTSQTLGDAVAFVSSSGKAVSVATGEQNRLAAYVGGKAKNKDPFWAIELPIPDDIWYLRQCPFNYLNATPYPSGVFNDTYINNGMNFYQMPPLIYILTYGGVSSSSVHFTGNNKDVPIDHGIARLHFYAEPETPKGMHPIHALPELDNLFTTPLTLEFDPTLGDPDQPIGRDSSIPSDYQGVLLMEERSLSERDSTPTFASFEKVVQIKDQYAAFLKYKNELNLERSRSGSKQAQKKYKLLASDTKPPSNCMSLIGTV